MIKKLLLTLVCSFLLIVPAYAQCTGPSCPIHQHPNYRAPSNNINSAVVEKIKHASVRVAARISSRTTAFGSGTVFIWGDSVGILTAGHVIEDANDITIIHESLGSIPCKVLCYNINTDYAILEPIEKQEELWKVGVNTYYGGPLSGNTQLILAGFNSHSVVTIHTGFFRGYRSVTKGRWNFGNSVLIVGSIDDYKNKRGILPINGFKSTTGLGSGNWMAIDGIARSGDSGGGVFTQDGSLVGNIWGSDMRNEVVATWIGPTTEEIGKTCFFNWRRKPKTPKPDEPAEGPPATNPDPDTGASNSPSKPNPPKPSAPEIVKPPVVQFNLLGLLWPSLLVLFSFIAFLVAFLVIYFISLSNKFN